MRNSTASASRGTSPRQRLRYSALAIAVVVVAAWFGPRFLIDAEPASTTVNDGPPAEERETIGVRDVEHLRARVLTVYDHDPRAYTQGLVWYDGKIFESTGQYGDSSLQRWDLDTGEVEKKVTLPPDLFGEGLAMVGERLVQLTWRQGIAFVYRPGDLSRSGKLAYEGEGWGLCFDGEQLFMSDGTHVLTVRDPEDLSIIRRLVVTRRGTLLDRLNELECVEGWIFANVYQTDEIVKIDPKTGMIHTTIDASGLLSPSEQVAADVLNGIAYRPTTKTFLLTGKHWPKLFEVVFE